MTAADLVASSIDGVRRRPLRSVASATGFAVGTGAVVALLAVAAGARAEILARFQGLGLGVVSVRAIGARTAGDPPALVAADVDALRSGFSFVRSAAPVRVVERPVRLPDERLSVRVVGTSPDYFALRHARFERGRSFTAEEGRRADAVCVLGAEAAARLFPTGEAYGSLANVGGNWYRVVGVLAPSDGQEGTGREVYLPLATTFETASSGREELREILVKVDDGVDPEAAATVLERTLERRRGGQAPFAVRSAEALLREARAARSVLDRLLVLAAALAFALGGGGLSALSWQAVSERRREIAVRRAIGARKRDVLAQFLIEGGLVAAGGATLGALAGGTAIAIAARLGAVEAIVDPVSAVVAVLAAVALGLAAATPPARRAASVDPVTALRFEG